MKQKCQTVSSYNSSNVRIYFSLFDIIVNLIFLTFGLLIGKYLKILLCEKLRYASVPQFFNI